MAGDLLRTILMWIAAFSSILSLFLYLLDRFKVLNIVPWLIGGLIGLAIIAALSLGVAEVATRKSEERSDAKRMSISDRSTGIVSGGDTINSPITIGETPELKEERLKESQSAITKELISILQSLASQIVWTIRTQPEEPNIPRRPGETKAHFEDRARDEFARWIEYLTQGYQQYSLSDVTYISQKSNIAALEAAKRQAIENAYAAVRESRNRIFLYRKYQKDLLESIQNDIAARTKKANHLKDETINALTSHWFDILGNWLIIEQDSSNIQIVEDVILPQVVSKEHRPEALKLGKSGWQYSQLQLARLAQEKGSLMVNTTISTTRIDNPSEELTMDEPSEVVSKAGLAFMEGRPSDALGFIKKALKMDINAEQRHYLETSLMYLDDPDKFDGVLGAYLMNVNDSGAAAEAGLQKGDVILRYNNQLVNEPIELSKMVPVTQSAPAVAVEFLRDGKRMTKYLKGGVGLSATATTLVAAMAVAI